MATLFHTPHDRNQYNTNDAQHNGQGGDPNTSAVIARKKKIEQEEGELESDSQSDKGEEDVSFKSKRIKISSEKKDIKVDLELEDGEISSEGEISKKQKIEVDMKKSSGKISKSTQEKPILTEEELAKLRKELRERKLKLKCIPRLTFKEPGTEACLTIDPEKRIPLFLTDIQHLLLYSVLGHHSPYDPTRWCRLEKYNRISQVVVFVAEGIALKQYIEKKESFSKMSSIFNASVEIVTPAVSDCSIISELVSVPLTGTQKNRLLKQFGSLHAALKDSKDIMVMMRAVFPIQRECEGEPTVKELPTGDKFSRTKLLLSPMQMVEENYPLPLKGELSNRYADFVLTKDSYAQVTESSPMFGIDCEMCRTHFGNELTRVSMVNEKYELVYEKLVKPRNKIIDYVTEFSGITREMLEDVTTRIEDVHRDLRALLPADAILVGQSLNSDLIALKMMHPYCIDSSVIFNITGNRLRKSKLKLLTKEFLGEEIQNSSGGHCSIEDSSASLKLVQLKLKNDIKFGDAVLEGPNKRKPPPAPIAPAPSPNGENPDDEFATSLFNQVTRNNKNKDLHSAQVFACEDVISIYNRFILGDDKKNIQCNLEINNKEVIKSTCSRSMEHKLTISHINLSSNKLTPEKIEKTTKKLDRWIEKVWNHMTYNSLYIVIFGGQVVANGACFMAIKKQPS